MLDKQELQFINSLAELAEQNSFILPELYSRFNVKRGLRNEDGTGVLVGLTRIGNVHGYIIYENERIPDKGKLTYRGIDIEELVNGFQSEGRFGFEEVCYLLLFGELPSEKELESYTSLVGKLRRLPPFFTENMILKNPSRDIMNKLQRSILALYSYDRKPDDISIANVLRQSIQLIARFPTIVAYGYQAKRHYYERESLVLHSPSPELSTAENLLLMTRPDKNYTKKEAELLDLALVLHAEHGGGNNSAFATRVITSTGTDTYSAISAAVGSLKGPKHGGANFKVMQMMEDIKENVSDWEDEKEIKEYLLKILRKEAFDHSGLIYGIGHAVYTLSDPRAILLKQKAEELAKEKERSQEFKLYENVEKQAITAIGEFRGTENLPISANVDFYSGFVYDMLGMPSSLYTPIFAVARIPGWCAHRIEQLVSEKKIIRPAYQSVQPRRRYIPLAARKSSKPTAYELTF